MTRDNLKEQIDELTRQYADGEINGATYQQKMMELTTSVQKEIQLGSSSLGYFPVTRSLLTYIKYHPSISIFNPDLSSTVK